MTVRSRRALSGCLGLGPNLVGIHEHSGLRECATGVAQPLPEAIFKSTPNLFGGQLPTLKQAEAYLMQRAMAIAKGNQGIAASLLGITRQALNKRLSRKNKL